MVSTPFQLFFLQTKDWIYLDALKTSFKLSNFDRKIFNEIKEHVPTLILHKVGFFFSQIS